MSNLSRRDFLVSTCAAGLGTVSLIQGQPVIAAEAKPDDLLKRLIEGNNRFIAGKLEHPGRSPKDFLALAEGQSPPIGIVACADSRVAPEIIFDQGIGDLFVVRVAGNVVSGTGPLVKGSIEFAVGELGVRLLMVLGHSQCGAVKAAIEHIEGNDNLPGSIGDLIDPIRPAVMSVRGQPGDKLANVTKANVLAGVKRLETLDPILSKMVKSGDLKVVGGIYDLATGKVEIVS
ncbi:carbonic anhydrase [Planctomicrobium sp. SH527]|uniref:carbonic anhydrase n=1 Tax=Planctomicrobium sp. SH527 TaxID=3448123 RepID=UPI003F5AFE10